MTNEGNGVGAGVGEDLPNVVENGTRSAREVRQPSQMRKTRQLLCLLGMNGNNSALSLHSRVDFREQSRVERDECRHRIEKESFPRVIKETVSILVRIVYM